MVQWYSTCTTWIKEPDIGQRHASRMFTCPVLTALTMILPDSRRLHEVGWICWDQNLPTDHISLQGNVDRVLFTGAAGAHCALVQRLQGSSDPGLAGSQGRQGRWAPKSSDPGGVAGRCQKTGVTTFIIYYILRNILANFLDSDPGHSLTNGRVNHLNKGQPTSVATMQS